MYYDLHIHSALSPCGDDTMTINNIFHMAYIKGLDFIAITDHNSLKQQHHLKHLIETDLLKGKIDFVYGVELQTQENIHVLAYFQKDTKLLPIQEWIDNHLYKVENNPDYYGHQYVCNISDEFVDEEKYLLIQSLNLNIYEVVESIHRFGGVVILAHVMAKRFGIYEVYQGIPNDLNYDGIEVESIKQYQDLKKLCPTIDDEFVFINSDAHRLEDINEPVYQMDKDKFHSLWRKHLCKK